MKKRHALHIGISDYSYARINKSTWNKTPEDPKDLRNALNDAKAMRDITKHEAFFDTVSFIPNNDCTFGLIAAAIFQYSKIVKKGDLFVLTFAGHGTQTGSNWEYLDKLPADWERKLLGRHGEKREVIYIKKEKKYQISSSSDATWVLNDGTKFFDDYLTLLLKCFVPGSQILVISDSCNSGTIVDVHELQLSDNVLNLLCLNLVNSYFAKHSEKNLEIAMEMCNYLDKANQVKMKAGVISISAVTDENEALDSGSLNLKNGLFTANLMKVWNKGAFNGDYRTFYNEICNNIEKEMTDCYINLKYINTKLLHFYGPFIPAEFEEKLKNGDKHPMSFYIGLAENFVNISKYKLKNLPANITQEEKELIILEAFQKLWLDKVPKLVKKLTPYYNNTFAKLAPGFENSMPFS